MDAKAKDRANGVSTLRIAIDKVSMTRAVRQAARRADDGRDSRKQTVVRRQGARGESQTATPGLPGIRVASFQNLAKHSDC